MCVCMCVCVRYLADPLALHYEGLHLREVVVVGNHVGDDGLLIRVLRVHIWTGT